MKNEKNMNRINCILKKQAVVFSYRRKIVFIILAYVLIPVILFGFILFIINWNRKIDEYDKNYGNYLKNSHENINNLYYSNVDKIVYITMLKQVQDFLASSDEDDMISVLTLGQTLRDIFASMQLVNSNVSLTIFPLKNALYRGGEYIKDIENLDKATRDEVLASDNQSVVWMLRVNSEEYNNKNAYVCLYKSVRTIENVLAIVEIKIPFKKIEQSFAFDMPPDSFLAYLSESNEYSIIKNNGVDKDKISKTIAKYLKDRKSPLFHTTNIDIKMNGHRVVLFTGLDLIHSEFRNFLILYIAVMLLLIIVIYLSVRAVSSALTKRMYGLIKKLDTDVDRMIREKDDAPGILNFEDGEDEFGRISIKFSQMIRKIREYYQKYSEAELERHSLEMELLQANINPHFLYNTLSAIKWVYTDKKLAWVIDSMVRYYRLVLNRGENIHKVSKEMELIREYIELQKFAYDANFEYKIEVKPEVMDSNMIKNLLQPIVENAILHGVNGVETGGEIIVTGRNDGCNIIFEVSDNGIGMDRDMLEKISSDDYMSQYGGYGIKNVTRRIATYYGKDCGITVRSTVGQGTVVTLSIPFMK